MGSNGETDKCTAGSEAAAKRADHVEMSIPRAVLDYFFVVDRKVKTKRRVRTRSRVA